MHRYEWMIGPLRKWDQIAQTSKQITTKAHEPVQIRYKEVNKSTEDLTNNIIAPYQSPVTIPTQVAYRMYSTN